jgi:hypothetical protein
MFDGAKRLAKEKTGLTIIVSLLIGALAFDLLTRVIVFRHFSINFDWKWDFWSSAEAIGTISASVIALFGLNLKQIKAERWAAAKAVTFWISDEFFVSDDGSHYERKVLIHLQNQSDEPVYRIALNVTPDQGKSFIGSLSAPNPIPVLAPRTEQTYDISVPLTAYEDSWIFEVSGEFRDANNIKWERSADGSLFDVSSRESGWKKINYSQKVADTSKKEKHDGSNPRVVAEAFLALLREDPEGEQMQNLLAPEAAGWRDINWSLVQSEYRNLYMFSNVRYPAPRIARVYLTNDDSKFGQDVSGTGMQIEAKGVLTLTLANKGAWKVFGIGETVLPSEILFPPGTLS